MSITRGLSSTVNADYDGDKMWQRLLFIDSEFDTYEEFEKAKAAAAKIT
jgi:hypothetical protein